MPLSLTLGTSYPLSLEMKFYEGFGFSGRKDGDPSLGSQLINIEIFPDCLEVMTRSDLYKPASFTSSSFSLRLSINFLFTIIPLYNKTS